MIGPEQARVGDVIRFGSGTVGMVRRGPKSGGLQIITDEGIIWAFDPGRSFQLLSRIGGMPKSDGHRLGDLPVGTIVPGREMNKTKSGYWIVNRHNAHHSTVLREALGYNEYYAVPNKRVSVAYEAVEFQEPDE